MKTVIRATISVGLNPIIIREWENETIFENEKTYVFAIYLNDVIVETSSYYPSYKDHARNELIYKWTLVLNNISK